MQIKRYFIVFLIFVAGTLSFPEAGRCAKKIELPEGYLDAVFAPPTDEEISEVAAGFGRDFSCPRFEITGEFESDAVEIVRSDEALSVQTFEYESDGLKVTGMLARPRDGEKHAVIVLNHGGFSGLTGYDAMKIKEIALEGYIVVASTYRGEEGLVGGSEGEMDILGDEVRDVLNLLECAGKLEGANGKVGMLGGSHGGGITLHALARTDGVDAAVAMATPASMFAGTTRKMAEDWVKNPAKQEMFMEFFMTRDAMKRMKNIFGWIDGKAAPVAEVRANLLRRSPVYFVEGISAPLLFFYGEADPVCTLEMAMQLKGELEKHEKVFDYKIYPRMGHSLTGEAKKDANERMYKFFGDNLSSDEEGTEG